MNQTEEIEKPEQSSQVAKEKICPYIKLRTDESTRYSFAHNHNHCYKPKKNQPVRISYQETMCFSDGYMNCPVFIQEDIRSLPGEVRVGGITKKRKWLMYSLLSIGFLLIAAFFFFLFSRFSDSKEKLTNDNMELIPDTALSAPAQFIERESFIYNDNVYFTPVLANLASTDQTQLEQYAILKNDLTPEKSNALADYYRMPIQKMDDEGNYIITDKILKISGRGDASGETNPLIIFQRLVENAPFEATLFQNPELIERPQYLTFQPNLENSDE